MNLFIASFLCGGLGVFEERSFFVVAVFPRGRGLFLKLVDYDMSGRKLFISSVLCGGLGIVEEGKGKL